MFTGIVEELGEVAARELNGDGALLSVRGGSVLADLRPGASIAVDGVCLTVVEVGDGHFVADVIGETLARTALGALRAGSPVNLERPLSLAGRLGGHLVQGHVDGTGVIETRAPGDGWETVRVTHPTDLTGYVVPKGSIAVDGVSLTVVESADGVFSVGLIPETLRRTTLGGKRPGDPVNLEVDVIAKYVEKLMERQADGRMAGMRARGPRGEGDGERDRRDTTMEGQR
ncbi:MAG: riboflavin synthase [Streptosporangiaceae bacterium]